MTWSDELDVALDDIAAELGESSTWERYTFGTPSPLAGTRSSTLAASATANVVRTRDAVGGERTASGGRTAVERLEVWVVAADLSWTPTPDDTRVTIGGATYRPAAVERESDGKVYRCRLERLASA